MFYFEICLDAIHTTDVLNTLTQILHVRYNDVPLGSIGWLLLMVLGLF